MNTTLIINALAFLYLFVIWSKRDIINTIMKIVLFILMAANAFLALQTFGYIVKL